MTEDEIKLRLSELDRIFFNLRTTMLKGATSRHTDRGYHVLSISFDNMEDMQDAWKALYHAIRKHK